MEKLKKRLILLEKTLAEVLQRWRADADECDGIRETDYELYLKARKLVGNTETCPECGEPHPVLHCENCGHNWGED
jgi:DNA repair exonuclease SbcCD ATPase subunit